MRALVCLGRPRPWSRQSPCRACVSTTVPSAPSVAASARQPSPVQPQRPIAPVPPPGPAPARGALGRLRRRLWHRALTRGVWRPTTAARLHGWQRLREWDGADPAARLRMVKRLVWTPVRAWKEAVLTVGRHGAAVQAASGTPPSVQRRQIWWLTVRHGLDGDAYLDYQLHEAARRRRAAAIVRKSDFVHMGTWVNRHMARAGDYPVADKLGFALWCRARGLPAIPTLLEYEHGALAVCDLDGDPAAALPPTDLFSKPNDGAGGHGTARWVYLGDRRWADAEGRALDAEALLAALAGLSRTLARENGRPSPRILLQPCLRNHAALRQLTPGALCTVRILSCRALGERARSVMAGYRMPVGTTAADNFACGGLMAPIDMATGTLGAALQRHGPVLRTVERHPDTGAAIAGTRLPFWTESLAVCARALEAADPRPLLGWDVAITDDGPVLVEGNTVPSPEIQAITGVALGDTAYLEIFEARIRALMGC